MRIFINTLKIVGVILGVLLFITATILGYFTLAEYRPPKIHKETVQVRSGLKYSNEPLKIMTFNIGYAGLGKDEDFVMDGGKKGRSDSKAVVEGYFEGIKNLIETHQSDIYLFQEVDYDSRRSYHVNQVNELYEMMSEYDHVFSYNYKAKFVPFPFSVKDHFGRVNSGLQTLSKYHIELSFRHQLPGAFSWPIRTVNLKRAIQPNYIKIEGTDKYLVVINIHLSAYDDGSMRLKEMAYLKAFIEKEYQQGNYVIIGGDFNQTFYEAKDTFTHQAGTWKPVVMDENTLSKDFIFAVDPITPTCRSLHAPFMGSDFPCYIIDGFVVSKNITITNIETINHGFLYSDHNPVILEVTLNDL